jgi:hypothetical protein
MLQLGTGRAFAIPVGGNLATNPTPQEFQAIQDISLELNKTIKSASGQYIFPIDSGVVEGKATGKITFLQSEIQLFNQLMNADNMSVGGVQLASQTSVIPASTPFTVTVTNSANFARPFTVVYAGAGVGGAPVPLTLVASAPTVGQYSVSAGVYTFAAADEGKSVIINYLWTNATAGNTAQMNNQLVGYGPICELYVFPNYQGQNAWHLPAVRFGKQSKPLKRADYMVVEVDYEAFGNSAGLVFEEVQNAQ